MSLDLPSEHKRAQPLLRRLAMVLLLIFLVAAVLLVYAPTYCFMASSALKLALHSRGVAITFEESKGSVFEPLTLRGVAIEFTTSAGLRGEGRLAELALEFAPYRWLTRRETPFIDTVSVANGRVSLVTGAPAETSRRTIWTETFMIPSHIRVSGIDVTMRSEDQALSIIGLELNAGQVDTGTVAGGVTTLKTPLLSKSVEHFHGKTAMSGSWISLFSVEVPPGIRIEDLSTDLAKLLAGRAEIQYSVSAFGGTIAGQLQKRLDKPHSTVSASGVFSAVAVEQLAAFVSPGTEAGGILKSGKFSFRGTAERPERATASVRFEAEDFKWGRRKFNSLVASGTLLDRRLRLSEFILRQAKNSLTTKGEITLPGEGRAWWESDFAFDVSAKIEDLAALADLFGDRFVPMSGKVTAKGSVRGEEGSFSGQIIAGGGNLKYGDTPIERLHAAIQLDGNEVRLVNFELLRNDDVVRGQGVVNILGDKRYWGEVTVNVADLSLFESLPHPRWLPWPLEGGMKVTWSGDGIRAAHSGAFSATFEKARPAKASNRLPLSAAFEATYSPDNLYFTKFWIAQEGVSLSARINAAPGLTKLDDVTIRGGDTTRMRASAQIPVRLQELMDNGAKALRGDAPLTVGMKLDALPVAWIPRLAGFRTVAEGSLSGEISADGLPTDFSAHGEITGSRITLPSQWMGAQVEALDFHATIDGFLADVSNISAKVGSGKLAAAGEVNLRNLFDPNLRLAVTLAKMKLPVSLGREVTADAELSLNGPYSAAYLDGSMRLIAAHGFADFVPAALFDPDATFEPPLEPRFTAESFNDWRFDVGISAAEPLEAAPGKLLSPELRIIGPGANLRVFGTVEFKAKAGPREKRFSSIEGALFMGEVTRVAARAMRNTDTVLVAIGALPSPAVFAPLIDTMAATEILRPNPSSPASLFLDVPYQLSLRREAHQSEHAP